MAFTMDKKKVICILIICLMFVTCRFSKEKKELPLKLTYTLYGSTTVSVIKLINSSDSTLKYIRVLKNDETLPFITLDSMTGHSVMEYPRDSYIPRITLADKIKLTYQSGLTPYEEVFFLARYIPMSGEWGKK